MNIKEQLMKEIEQMPEEQLQQVLEFVRSLESVQLPSNATVIVGALASQPISSRANNKEKWIREIEQMLAEKVLEFARSLESTDQEHEEEAWQAYLKSEQRREEVYQRLAKS